MLVPQFICKPNTCTRGLLSDTITVNKLMLTAKSVSFPLKFIINFELIGYNEL